MYVPQAALVAALFFCYLQAFVCRSYLNRRKDPLRGFPLSASGFLLSSACLIFFGLLFTAALLGSASTAMEVLSRTLIGFGLAAAFCLAFSEGLFAVIGLISVLLFRPWELYPYHALLAAVPRLFAILACIMFIREVARKGPVFVYRSTGMLLFLALILCLLASCLFSQTPVESISYFFERFLPISVIFLLILQCVRDDRDVALLLRIIAICIFGVIAAAIFNTLYSEDLTASAGRLTGGQLLGNANDLASLICIGMPLYLAFLLNTSAHKWRSFFWQMPVLVVFFTGLWMSQSRGAMISLGVATFVSFIFKGKLRMRNLAFASVLLVILALAYQGFQRDSGEMSASSESRWNYVIAGWNMVKSNPLFGVGIGNYPLVYEQYTPNFLEWGERTAHSSWVLVASEAGPLSFILFLLLNFYVLKQSFMSRAKFPQLSMALIAYLVAFSFLSHTYLFIPYILYALIIAAAKPAGETVSSEPLISANQRALTSRYSLASLILFSVLGGFCLPTRSAQATPMLVNGIDKPLGAKQPVLVENLNLFGSRGEVLNFLVKAPAQAGCLSPTLSGVEFVNSRIFHLPAIHTMHPSYPGAPVGAHLDPAIDLQLGKLDCTPESLALGNWFLVDLEISREAKPGNYQIALNLADSQAGISLTIWPMQMPEKPAVPFYSELSTWFNLLGHYGKWANGEGDLAESYFIEMRKHRVLPLTAVISTPKIIREAGHPVLDLKHSPNAEQSFQRVNLSNRPAWAHIGFPTIPKEQAEAPENAEYFTALENTVRQNGFAERSMIYLWDEPQPEEMPRLKLLAKTARQFSPSVKLMVTRTLEEDLKPLFDIFVPVMDHFEDSRYAGEKEYREWQNQGGEFWWYVSCMSHGCEALAESGRPDLVIDRPSAHVRVISWLSLMKQANAFLYYIVNHGYQHYPKRDPWDSLWDFSGNGDGTLFYPGRRGERGFRSELPIPSLRLKLLRESSYDGFYLSRALAKNPEWLNSELTKLVQSTSKWSRDYNAYTDLRVKIGNYLAKEMSENK